jgi:hypothetical protein
MQSSGGHLLKKVTDYFLKLSDFLNEFESQISDDVLPGMMKHLRDMQITVKSIFHLW